MQTQTELKNKINFYVKNKYINHYFEYPYLKVGTHTSGTCVSYRRRFSGRLVTGRSKSGTKNIFVWIRLGLDTCGVQLP